MINLKCKLHYYRNSIFIILISGLVACATNDLSQLYEGDTKPDNEIAKILLPASLEVAEIDNKSIRTPFNPDGFQPIGLLPGKHKIRVYYKEHWGASTGGGVAVSDVFDFDVTLEAGKEYVFKHNGPKDLVDADIESTVNDIKIWLYQPDTKITTQASGRVAYGNFINRAVMSAAAYSPSSESVKQSETTLNELEQLQTNWKAADDRQRNSFKTWVANRSATAKPPTENNAADKAKNANTQLQHWWKMADEKQRKAFSDWIANRSIDGKGLL
ncbi:MAG: DUF2057 family protein [Gammaproteobacteria bacterium]